MTLPAPCDLGLPAAFTAWRPGQEAAILHAIDTPRRFAGLVLPTGFGKSLVYMAIAHLTGQRTVILTSTLALQRQLVRDFHALNAAVVQGQRRYVCHALSVGGELYARYGSDRHGATMVDHGPCHLGVNCSLKAAGCGYFDALRAAQDATLIITNYAWWLSLYTNPHFRLHTDLLVCDEAHAAPDALASAIGAAINAKLLRSVTAGGFPKLALDDAPGWIQWARTWAATLARGLEGTQPATREAVIAIRQTQTLHRELHRIASIRPELLVVSEDLDGYKFDVAWAAGFAEPWLFRHTPRVVLTSATMTGKTADLLGIMEKDLTLYEAGDGFPLARRPVYIAPAKTGPWGETLRVDHRNTDDDEAAWVAHIDAILGARRDRKGIIQTVSYRRRDAILARSAYRGAMIVHGRTDTAEQIAKFKAAGPGAILVSPAVTTGYDFPYGECEFQILSKIPFPDSRDPITKARSIVDKQYPAHLAMQELIQGCGRGMRAEDDRCETFIVDGHAVWFLSKHANLAPRWFRRALRRLDPGSIPTPPPSLGSSRVP